jgi:hypothetical protein
MDRREFLAKAGLVATWAAISVRISGCSDEEDNPGGPDNGDVAGDVAPAAGHTHAVTITEAQLQAGAGVTLTLTTSSGHNHTVTLSSDQVMDIGGGTAVVDVTDPDGTGHTHVVSFN